MLQLSAAGKRFGQKLLFEDANWLITPDERTGLVGGNGTAGIAASTTAGNAAAVPLLVAAANHNYANAAGPATVLVAASVIVSSMLVPPLTAWWKARVTRHTLYLAGRAIQEGD